LAEEELQALSPNVPLQDAPDLTQACEISQLFDGAEKYI
jgi:hypothetical protein